MVANSPMRSSSSLYMAAPSPSPSDMVRLLSIFSMASLILIHGSWAQPSPSPSPSPSPAPAPAPEFVNITQVLIYAGDYATFVSLLNQTGVDVLFQRQANDTSKGISIFAPTNKAFTSEPAASLLKNVTDGNQLKSLLEYHALNQWTSLADLQKTNDTVISTFASYNAPVGGNYRLNVTFVNGVVRVLTAWNNVPVTNTPSNTFPVSIFSIDQVLIPVDLFGNPAPSPAPSPSSALSPTSGPASDSPSSSSSSSSPSSNSPSGSPSFSAPLPSPLSSTLAIAIAIAIASAAASFLF